MTILPGERFSFYSHLAGAIAAAVGTIALIWKTVTDATYLTTAIIYGISVTFLFTASSLYHANKKHENENSVWRKIDHVAIFVMIAGTYTPVCIFYLDGYLQVGIIAAQWAIVLAGFFLTVFYVNAPRILYTLMYLMMGWMAILLIKEIINTMSPQSLFYLFSGGIAFTTGAIIYALKRPLLKPGLFSFHELFHLFVLLGAVFHYLMVNKAFALALSGAL
jgi:hemolysin III